MSLPKHRPAVDVRAAIRARLVEIGMSRHALAAAAGISHQHLYAFLHEDPSRQKELSAVLLGRVLGVLGIELRGRRWKQRATKAITLAKGRQGLHEAGDADPITVRAVEH